MGRVMACWDSSLLFLCSSPPLFLLAFSLSTHCVSCFVHFAVAFDGGIYVVLFFYGCGPGLEPPKATIFLELGAVLKALVSFHSQGFGGPRYCWGDIYTRILGLWMPTKKTRERHACGHLAARTLQTHRRRSPCGFLTCGPTGSQGLRV